MSRSGVYLVVGNFDEPHARDVLRATKGGYPHITFLYAGGDSMCNVGEIACQVLEKIVNENGLPQVLLAPENVTTNSFLDTSSGRERHGVLIYMDDKSETWVDYARIEFVSDNEDYDGSTVRMHKPHVMHSIHCTKADADAAAAVLRTQLPLTGYITGVTID